MKKTVICTLGGHSALEIFAGAKKYDFNTLAIVAKGRDKTYSKYFRNICDDLIYLESFKELTSQNTIKQLIVKHPVFIPHRYIQVYCSNDKFENNFPIKIFGNKFLLKYEDREGKYNQ